MKKIRQYLGMRSMRLGALAVLVATFVGLPALGRAVGTTMFDKIDAVNYLSSVLLAEDYYMDPNMSGGSYSSGSTSYTQPTYTDSSYSSGSTTYTQPTYTSGSTSTTQSTYTDPYMSGSTTYTQPTYTNGSTTQYQTGTTYTQPTYTNGSTTQYQTGTTTQQSGGCTTPDQCAQMSNGQYKASDFTCSNGYCSMTQYQTGTQYNQYQNGTNYTSSGTNYTQYPTNTYQTGTQYYNGTSQTGTCAQGTDCSGQYNGCAQGTTCSNTQYNGTQYNQYQNGQMQNGQYQYNNQYQTTGQFMPGQTNMQYTDYSSRSEKYGEFAEYFNGQQGNSNQYGFQNCSDQGCSFSYGFEGDKYQQEVGTRITSEKSMLEKDLQRNSNVAKSWSRFSSRTSRLAQKFTDVASKITSKGGDASIMTTLIQGLAKVDADVTGVINEINTYYSSLASSISALSDTSTQGDVENIRTGMQLLNTYEMLSGTMETRVNAIQMSEGFGDMLVQMASTESQFGGNVPDEVQSNIDSVTSQIENLVGYVDRANDAYSDVAEQIATIRGYTDPQQIQDAMRNNYSMGDSMRSFMDEMQNDFQDFWESRPFDSLHSADKFAQFEQMKGSMGDQLGGMKEGLAEAKEFLASLKKMNITKPSVVAAIASLNDSAAKMSSVLEKMQSAVGSAGGQLSGEQMDKFFQIQDSIMRSVDTNMKIVTDYLNSNKSTWSKNADADLITQFLADEEMRGEEDMNSYDSSFNDMYADVGTEGFDLEALKAKIKADVIAEVTREISATLMAEVAKFIGDDKAGEILSNFLNKSTIFGEKGTAALQATTDVLNAVAEVPSEDDAVITEGTEDSVEVLYATLDEVQTAVISEDLTDDMKDAVAEAADILSTGGDTSEINAVNKEIETLLAKNDSSLTDNGLQFNDIKIADSADTWYFDSVMSLREEGVVKGKGEGNYDPAGQVTYAEVAKMAMEAAGEGQSDAAPKDGSANGQWYEGYVASVEKHAPEFAAIVENDPNIGWNDPAPRQYVAVLIAEAFDLEKSAYEGDFKDVSSSDPHAQYIQAVADYGIMTGDSNGGTYRPDDGINRAEVAKVIYTADQSVGTTQAMDSTLSDADEFLNSLGFEESSAQGEMNESSTLEKLVSFLRGLRAMLPFLN
ncbi:S-layer homology domain-containing protein [Candidatus Peregrinibacteria bacterium]|nr:S-layer homology domain-containing protein [Candidatus Peregrinibacteria bacterium]